MDRADYWKEWKRKKSQDPRWVEHRLAQQREYKAAELADPERGRRRREIQHARHIERMKADPEYAAKKRAQWKTNTERCTKKANDDPEYRRATVLRHRLATFKITLNQYEGMLEHQQNRCAICRQSERHIRDGKVKELAIDHCHTTGIVRGLLCHDCNTMLGMSKDNIETLKAAIRYLESNFS